MIIIDSLEREEEGRHYVTLPNAGYFIERKSKAIIFERLRGLGLHSIRGLSPSNFLREMFRNREERFLGELNFSFFAFFRKRYRHRHRHFLMSSTFSFLTRELGSLSPSSRIIIIRIISCLSLSLECTLECFLENSKRESKELNQGNSQKRRNLFLDFLSRIFRLCDFDRVFPSLFLISCFSLLSLISHSFIPEGRWNLQRRRKKAFSFTDIREKKNRNSQRQQQSLLESFLSFSLGERNTIINVQEGGRKEKEAENANSKQRRNTIKDKNHSSFKMERGSSHTGNESARNWKGVNEMLQTREERNIPKAPNFIIRDQTSRVDDNPSEASCNVCCVCVCGFTHMRIRNAMAPHSSLGMKHGKLMQSFSLL